MLAVVHGIRYPCGCCRMLGSAEVCLMPQCPPDEQLRQLLAQQLDADEQQSVDAHLRECAACAARLSHLVETAFEEARHNTSPSQPATIDDPLRKRPRRS